MVANVEITNALLLLHDGRRLCDAWWTDQAVVMAINTIQGLEITAKQLNIAVSRDEDAFRDVDNHEGLNVCGIMRVRKKVNGVKQTFYFFQKKKHMVIPQTLAEWTQIINKRLPRLSPRRTAKFESESTDAETGNPPMVESAADVENPQQNTPKRQ